jgi:hypothetical protein
MASSNEYLKMNPESMNTDEFLKRVMEAHLKPNPDGFFGFSGEITIYPEHFSDWSARQDSEWTPALHKFQKSPARKWLNSLLESGGLVGFDTEWRPDRSKEQNNPVALIQLCGVDGDVCRVCLFRTRKNSRPVPLPDVVSAVLRSPKVRKIGVGVGNDQIKLGFTLANLQGIEKYFKNFPRPGLSGLTEAFGFPIFKSRKRAMSNWEKNTLTREDISYAANDAFFPLILYLMAMTEEQDMIEQVRLNQSQPVRKGPLPRKVAPLGAN